MCLADTVFVLYHCLNFSNTCFDTIQTPFAILKPAPVMEPAPMVFVFAIVSTLVTSVRIKVYNLMGIQYLAVAGRK